MDRLETRMTLAPDETRLRGKWTFFNGQMRQDSTCRRIEQLVTHHLRKVAQDESGWQTLFLDPMMAGIGNGPTRKLNYRVVANHVTHYSHDVGDWWRTSVRQANQPSLHQNPGFLAACRSSHERRFALAFRAGRQIKKALSHIYVTYGKDSLRIVTLASCVKNGCSDWPHETAAESAFHKHPKAVSAL